MAKSIQNADFVAYKLKPSLIKATNYKVKVVKEKQHKKKKMVETRKIEAMATKFYKNKKKMS